MSHRGAAKLSAVGRASFVPIATLLGLISLMGCGGVSGADTLVASSHLSASASSIDFGAVGINSSKEVNATLTAGFTAVTIQTASWSGAGFSLEGITFPKTLTAGETATFKVTFQPESVGSVTGALKFFSDAANSPTQVTMTGTGMSAEQHSVTLSWNPSTAVQGYYVYRGDRTGGPYSRISALEADTIYKDSTVTGGRTYTYVVTALSTNAVESGYSNEAIAVIPQ